MDEADGLKLHPLAWGKSGPLVRAEGLSLSYGGRTVCAGLTFTLRPGERMAVTGPNGCGKSTLLKKLCGQDVAACGTLALGAWGLLCLMCPRTHISARRRTRLRPERGRGRDDVPDAAAQAWL